tara:strand:- start:2049 stop:3281 length:1233 start_codon:yes stop_codon:yes gene_type:complete
MKIVFICQWFPPEPAPIGVMINELASRLSNEGHQITVITGYPNHPNGLIYKGFKKKIFSIHNEFNFRLIRCWLFTSNNKTNLNRLLNYISFSISSLIAALFLERNHFVFVVSPPLTNGLIAIMLRLIKGFTYIINIQDIYPDAAINLNVIKNPFYKSLLYLVESIIYNFSERITVISNGFKKNLIKKKVSYEKIKIIPNWIDTDEITPIDNLNNFKNNNQLNNNFIVLYAGTIGLVSGAEILIPVAKSLAKYKDIKILLIGDGIIKERLQELSKNEKLGNIKFLPFQPREILSEVLSSSDVSIVTMKKNCGFSSVPSKVLGYMSSGKPLIASVDKGSDTHNLILNSNCGLAVPPENSEEIVSAILYLYHNQTEARKMGTNAREYVVKNFSKDSILNSYISFFLKLNEYGN